MYYNKYYYIYGIYHNFIPSPLAIACDQDTYDYSNNNKYILGRIPRLGGSAVRCGRVTERGGGGVFAGVLGCGQGPEREARGEETRARESVVVLCKNLTLGSAAAEEKGSSWGPPGVLLAEDALGALLPSLPL